MALLVDAVERRRAGEPALVRVATLNPEMLMRGLRTPALGAALRRVELALADGVGIVLALRRRGLAVTRVTGVELVDRYAAEAARRGHRLALVGAGPGVAAAAAAALCARHPGLAVAVVTGADPGPELAATVRAGGADAVLAAYSMEAQAAFLDAHLAASGAAVGIGVGGTLDFLAGRVRRAPSGLRRAGLEWLWRLLLEPWRWRRQLDLPRFWRLAAAETRATRRRGGAVTIHDGSPRGH